MVSIVAQRRPPKTENAVRAWDLRQQGWTERRIAEDLGITQQRVSQILKVEEARALEHLKGTIENHKARQTAVLEDTIDRAIRTYALQDVEHADAKLLEVARKCLVDIRKIWGIEPQPEGSGVDIRLALELTRAAREAYADPDLPEAGDGTEPADG
jgi:predicted transcriptional regulator